MSTREETEVFERGKSSAAATQAPTTVLRVKVTETATASAGITSAAHRRSRRSKSSRARAIDRTSITRPENVMQ